MDDIPEEDNIPFVIAPPVPSKPPDVHILAALARQIGTNMRPLDDVLIEYGISKEAYDAQIVTNTYFKNALDDAIKEWNSPMKTADRVRLKSQMIVEDALPELGQRMLDRSTPLRDAVEAGKWISKMGELGEQQSGSSNHERVSITINMGDQTLHFEKTPRPAEIRAEPEGSSDTISVQPLPEGPRQLEHLPAQSEGDSSVPAGQPKEEPST